MKKITFYLMMLLGVTAFSQIEIVENFDGGIPAGWTNSGLSSGTTGACGGSGQAVSANLFDAQTGTITTPNYIGISNGTAITINFSYNVFSVAFGFPPSFNAPPAGWGSIDLDYSTNGGTNWQSLISVDDTDFTFVDIENCATASTTLPMGTIASGEDVQIRASAINTSGVRLYFVIDNLSITQVADTVPNCDATLISPANGSTTADSDTTLTWTAATGLATGYKVSVGTTMGGTEVVNEATTTETSYSLSGLSYETLYYVNIVPFNSFGDAMTCTEESFTTRVAPIAGATCSTAVSITNFPYILPMGDTNDYENNIDVSPCNNGYMRGKDVFYEITPTEDISINIDLTSITNNGASIHVVQGCPDVATECVAYVGTFNTSGGSLNLSDVVLLAGNTYYVVLSNSSASRTYTYSLIIQRNSCINPTFTLANVSDCGNDQFSIDVDVTYLGSATSLTLSDDSAATSDITNITSTGVVNIGPYPSGTTVNVSLTNDQDSACLFDDSTFYYCPPENDECTTATDLTVNTDGTCTTLTVGTNVGATESVADPNSCTGTATNDVWYSFVATNETLILEYFNVTPIVGTATSMTTELLEGNCGTLTSLACYNSNSYIVFNNLTVNNTYYVRNRSAFSGNETNFVICLKTPPAPPVNDECSGAIALTASTDDQCNNSINGTTVGATRSADSTCPDTSFSTFSDVWYVFNPGADGFYEFSFTLNSGAPSSYYIYSGSCGSLTDISSNCNSTSNQILDLDSSETYYVMVKSSQSEAGADFDLCVYALPPAVANSDCSGAIALIESPNDQGGNTISSNLDNAYPSAEACNTSNESVWYTFTPTYTGMYNFDFTRVSGSASYTVYNTDNCSQASTSGYVTGFSSCFNSGDKTAELVAGTTYLIVVHASSAASFELFAYPDPSLSVDTNTFETFKYYPNPVVNTLTIESGNTISNVRIFNIVGQQVQVTAPNNLKTTVNMNALEDGVYFVTVTINNAQKTFKVIKK
ncbi:Por secretion system C-terminal sorting domain-containing protein [Bizionia echini]|uniref:Por secretion system C-terminal sorting domain-containing protein n=1 Tax=Bizionia echini TaxID=649333 RepID=A0A1I4ZK62_9FLAO|nr:T9SS type A sorting domain-containing protein [Bizionia echini]SFN50453.1 Por secretion system C-terminal sorting domain-containing protein [Bizionia echini]